MKNITYILLIILLSLAIRWTTDYPLLMAITSISWCVVGFLLIRNILESVIKKRNKQ